MTESFINKNGTLPRIMISLVVAYMKKTKGKLITITYQAIKPTRSLLQNSYYWAVVVKMLAMEIGYTPEVMHGYMKDLFLGNNPVDFDMPDGYTFIQGVDTKSLTTIAFENYIYEIRKWADEFLSLNIPLPHQTQFDYTGYE